MNVQADLSLCWAHSLVGNAFDKPINGLTGGSAVLSQL